MATVKQRVHKFNGSDYDIIHYETEASVVLYTKNSQTNVEGALDTLFTDVAGKAASSHNHAASNITSGTLGVARGGTGANTFTSGAALIGAGTNAVTTKAIDSTSGGTANSASLITSGAVNAGLATKSNTGHTHTSSNITDFTTAVQGVTINASKITGVLSLDNIPASAQERVVTVADQTARFALTTATVQLGDVVKQSDTGLLYFVTDTSKLNQAAGYTEFTAGVASSVPWSGVTSKPSSFTPSSHTHGNITNDGKVGTTSGYAVYTTTGGAVTAGTLATTDPTASGTSKTFIDTISQDAKGKITATKKTVATMTAATADAAGTTGLVPAPAAGAQAKFLRADATWQTPTNTTYSTFVKSGSTAAAGLVPKPSTTAGTTKYLREDATWAVPPDTNTTYSDFTAATSSAAGTHGLVPAPASGKQDSFLRGNKTWATANDIINTLTTGNSDSTAADYLVSQYAGGGTTTTTYHRRPVSKVVNATIVKAALGTGTGTTKYLREDGTWQVPPNTTYSTFVKSGSTAAAGLVPKPSTTAGTTKYLREDATWVAPPNTNTTYTFATGSSNGTISVTPSGGSASNIAVKGLGSAAYTASTAYLGAGLGFYASSAATTPYYVTTSITVATSANAWINGMIEGSRGNTTRPLMVRFMVYWNKSTLSNASFYDPMGGISEISAHLDASNKVYFSFKCATQYSQIRFFAYTGTTATGCTNVATAISATAPATFSVTKAMTQVYEVRTTTTVGSASAGTAIAADDITAWSAGTLPSLTVTSTACDDITAWSAGTAASASISSGVLTITNGTKPSLSYTARSVGSASGWSTGTLPSLTYTARSIPNISVTSKTVAT